MLLLRSPVQFVTKHMFALSDSRTHAALSRLSPSSPSPLPVLPSLAVLLSFPFADKPLSLTQRHRLDPGPSGQCPFGPPHFIAKLCPSLSIPLPHSLSVYVHYLPYYSHTRCVHTCILTISYYFSFFSFSYLHYIFEGPLLWLIKPSAVAYFM